MMLRSAQGRPASRRLAAQRRGTAMIVAIVCLLLVTAVSFCLVKYAMAAHEQSIRLGWSLQSAWLAESAMQAAASRLRDDPELSGEQWIIEDIGASKENCRVTIAADADPVNVHKRVLTVTADFPDDPVDRVRTIRSLTLTLPESSPAATN